MNLSNVKLPSNRKFGFFFTAVFLISATYAHYIGSTIWFYTLSLIGLTFFVITLIKAEILLPINKLWMKFGLLLSLIISPIVMGIIFFGLFTPVAIFMNLIGRDELRLKRKKQTSYWINRETTIQTNAFKQQF
tara:strand:- start:3512 stop:3910 length:399 start_codon:yes stop_codon:yes gene_type:complete